MILGKPNANAARVAVTRALARLMEHLDDSLSAIVRVAARIGC